MAKQAKTDRQAVIDSIRSQQSKRENRRGMAIVGVCVLVAVVIVGAAAFKPVKDWWDLRAYASDSLGEIGAKASAFARTLRILAEKGAAAASSYAVAGTDVTPVTERARLKKNGCGTLPLIGTS